MTIIKDLRMAKTVVRRTVRMKWMSKKKEENVKL
jgi:hypothetical protein